MQSDGWHLKPLVGVCFTLTTLVRISGPSDGSGASDDVVVVPDGFRNNVIATTLVTKVTPEGVSAGVSTFFEGTPFSH